MPTDSPPRDYERSNGRVRIRAYRAQDADAHYEAVRASASEVGRWLPWCHDGYSRGESAAWIASRAEAWASGTAFSFAVTDPDDTIFLGGCGLNRIDPLHACGSLGYWVRTDATGHGWATGAARLVARFGFERLGLQRIEISMGTGNHASRRVAEKMGAVREGTKRHGIRLRGAPRDAHLFSLVPADLAS